jgi:hypothetical protein
MKTTSSHLLRLFVLSTVLALSGTAAHAVRIPGVVASTDMGSGFATNIQNTVNGAGLSTPTLTATHGPTSPSDSWVSSGTLTGTITFDLGAIYTVSGFSFWNQNGGGPSPVGDTGIKGVVIEQGPSASGPWTPITGAPTQFAKVSFFSGAPPEQFTFPPVATRFIRFTVTSNWGDPSQTGFAEVGFDGLAENPPLTVLHFGAATGGDPAPGAPAGTTLKKFGVPSLNNEGGVAFIADTASPAGSGKAIFAGTALAPLVQKEDAAPGVPGGKFAGFRDPVLTDSGSVTFLGKVKGTGITSANASGVWTNLFTGSIDLVARAGDEPPGVPGGQWKSFSAVAADDADEEIVLAAKAPSDLAGRAWTKLEHRKRSAAATTNGLPMPTSNGAVAFLAKMVEGSGGVTSDDDTGLWIDTGSGPLLVLREGQPFDGSTIKSFKLMTARSGAAGQGHALEHSGSTGYVVALIKLADGRQVWGQPVSDGSFYYTAGTGDAAPGYLGASFKSFGVPGQNSVAAGAAVAKVAGGDATSANDAAIFFEESIDYDLHRAVAEGDPAAGVAGATFASFGNPVNNTNDELAFAAKIKGSGLTSANDQGIWWGNGFSTPSLVAREGAEPPGVAGGAWKQFKSLALPEAGAPLFYAKLSQGPAGVTKNDDDGVWGMDSSATLHLLLREGMTITAGGSPRVVKKFTTLGPVGGSSGQTRFHNDDRQVIARVQFVDGTQAIVRVQLF